MSNRYGPRIVTDGLVLCLDAADRNSYPGSGNTWYDLSGQGAHCESLGSPIFVENGASSYWQMGSGQKFNSIDISQNYKDLFVIYRLESNSGINMIFGKYPNIDASFRLNNGMLRSSTNSDDWEHLETSKTFFNGSFNSGGTSVYNKWSFTRVYRTNTSDFGNSFRYEVSSAAYSRYFMGKINYIACYNRELSNEEVLQNYNTLKGRFGL